MRLSQRLGAPLERPSGGFRNFPSALLPAERRGRRIFGRSCRASARRLWNSSLSRALAASRRGLVFAYGASGSSLFDNCIGRKRDVGGGVLAGLRLLGRIPGRKLKEPTWRFESE